eukprot:878868-Lingulodinium_polyedra.AAC.1
MAVSLFASRAENHTLCKPLSQAQLAVETPPTMHPKTRERADLRTTPKNPHQDATHVKTVPRGTSPPSWAADAPQ